MDPGKGDEKNYTIPSSIVRRYEKTQTGNAKWLQIDKPLLKMYRQHFYDIGGTYIQDVLDFWFTFSTEIVGNIILVHLFVYNYKKTHFVISSSLCHQHLSIDKKRQTVHLTAALEDYSFSRISRRTLSHVTTYSFNEMEVQAFESKTLLISIKISHHNQASRILENSLEKIKLSHDCHRLLTDIDTSDFVFESDTGDHIPAHKLILKTHSKVFETMFKDENQHSFKQDNHMVETCCTEDLKHFLEFMYTGTIDDVENCNVLVMLMLADKYEVHGLRELAEHMLHLDLNIENCFEMLNVGDVYNCEKFKFSALNFIKQNAAKLEFKNLGEKLVNKKLIYEITDYLLSQSLNI